MQVSRGKLDTSGERSFPHAAASLSPKSTGMTYACGRVRGSRFPGLAACLVGQRGTDEGAFMTAGNRARARFPWFRGIVLDAGPSARHSLLITSQLRTALSGILHRRPQVIQYGSAPLYLFNWLTSAEATIYSEDILGHVSSAALSAFAASSASFFTRCHSPRKNCAWQRL